MSLAASSYEPPYAPQAAEGELGGSGAQTLLHLEPPPPNYFARIGAIALYLALLGAIVTVGFKTNEAPVEEQQVVELAPVPVDEQPIEDTPPPPEEVATPDIPPPMALDPIAPVEEVKPVEKPKVEKKIEKKVEHAPTPRQETAKPAPHVAAPAVRAPAPPPGATISSAANHYHACLQAAAANFDPPIAGRVTYHATVSPSGTVTGFSITSSSNPSLASIASRLGGRCGSVPAPGVTGSLSGAISFHP